jgi:hypothetical protein
MGHQPHNVSGRIGDSCNVVKGTVGISAIPDQNLSLLLDFLKTSRVKKESAFLMGDRQRDAGSGRERGGKGSVNPFHHEGFFLAKKGSRRIGEEDPRKKSGFGKDLEAIADSQDRLAF